MSLETATYINGLVPANPLGSDPLADADGHLRLLKSTLKATFPNITGPVTATQGQLNTPFPVGGIIMWSGSTGSIPTGWLLCDGNNSTPDLRDKFIVGAGNTYSVGGTGGASSVTLSESNIPAHTHSFSGSSASAGNHNHTVNDPGHSHVYTRQYANGGYAAGGGAQNTQSDTATTTSTTGITLNAAGDHTHTISGTIGSTGSGTSFSIIPPYYALAFIMKGAY